MERSYKCQQKDLKRMLQIVALDGSRKSNMPMCQSNGRMCQSNGSMGASQIPVHGRYEPMMQLAQGGIRITELIFQSFSFRSVVVASLRVDVEQCLLNERVGASQILEWVSQMNAWARVKYQYMHCKGVEWRRRESGSQKISTYKVQGLKGGTL